MALPLHACGRKGNKTRGAIPCPLYFSAVLAGSGFHQAEALRDLENRIRSHSHSASQQADLTDTRDEVWLVSQARVWGALIFMLQTTETTSSGSHSSFNLHILWFFFVITVPWMLDFYMLYLKHLVPFILSFLLRIAAMVSVSLTELSSLVRPRVRKKRKKKKKLP